jgi:pimeloyl-ACP methyl ester carboxylesterase
VAVEIVMPRVDMDMATGKMGRWRAGEGAHVVEGAALFEIETDKAAMEVDAPASGVLRYVAASEGDVLPVGACIGWIVAEDEDFTPPAAKDVAAEAPSMPGFAESKQAVFADVAPDAGLRATPAARRAARERGLTLQSLTGSGPRGRIQRRDVKPRDAAAPCASNLHRLWLQQGRGAPIVFVHGFGADLNGWRPVVRLLPHTQPALALDLPGHGLSPLGDDASFEALVEAARAALIEESAGEAHLVGHSLGGAVAAALSHAPDVKALSLMLIAPAGLGEEINAAFFEGFLQAATEPALTPWLQMLVRDPARLVSALARTTLRQRQERPLVADQRRLAQAIFSGGRQAIDVRALLDTPKAPTKIVVGLEDRVAPAHHADGLSGLIGLHRLAQVGHLPHLEATWEIARLIEELVASGQRMT